MNNYTFKNILFVVPEKPFYKVLYAQTIIFRYFMELKLSCCLSIFQGKHPQSYMSWLRVAVRFWVIGLFPFCSELYGLPVHSRIERYFLPETISLYRPSHTFFAFVSDCMDLTFVFQLLFKVCSFASFAMSYGERLA